MDDEHHQRWDQEIAERLIGAVVLVGITNNEPDGARLVQFFGTVIEATEHSGITMRLCGSRSGETYQLPPDTRAFFAADPGEYRLRSTGEVVKDPDYTTSWTITPPMN